MAVQQSPELKVRSDPWLSFPPRESYRVVVRIPLGAIERRA
jgi:hypothetical protein